MPDPTPFVLFIFMISALFTYALCANGKAKEGRCRDLSHGAKRKEGALLLLRALAIIVTLFLGVAVLVSLF